MKARLKMLKFNARAAQARGFEFVAAKDTATRAARVRSSCAVPCAFVLTFSLVACSSHSSMDGAPIGSAPPGTPAPMPGETPELGAGGTAAAPDTGTGGTAGDTDENGNIGGASAAGGASPGGGDGGAPEASPELTASDAEFVADDQWPLGEVVGTLTATDSGARALSFTIVDGDSDSFAVDAEGDIRIAAPLDREAQAWFPLKVQVQAGEDTLMVDANIRVTTSRLVDGQVPALGDKKALWIRGQFNGEQGEQTEADIADAMISLNKYWNQESLGEVSIPTWEVTPYVEVGVSKKDGDAFREIYAVRDLLVAAAKDSDPKFDAANYDLIFLSLPSGVITGGGALGVRNGDVGTAWVPAPLWVPGTIHESFHMLGVGHADVLMGPETYPAPSGTGGHDPYYFMGSEGSEAKEPTEGLQYDIFAAINVPMKYRMGWLRESNLVDVANSSTLRIYSDKTTEPDRVRPYGARLKIDEDTIIASYEPGVRNSQLKTQGVVVHVANDAASRLLDARPNSVPDDPNIRVALNEVAEMSDAALALGESMTLGENWIISLVAEGESDGLPWADIKFERR